MRSAVAKSPAHREQQQQQKVPGTAPTVTSHVCTEGPPWGSPYNPKMTTAMFLSPKSRQRLTLLSSNLGIVAASPTRVCGARLWKTLALGPAAKSLGSLTSSGSRAVRKPSHGDPAGVPGLEESSLGKGMGEPSGDFQPQSPESSQLRPRVHETSRCHPALSQSVSRVHCVIESLSFAVTRTAIG